MIPFARMRAPALAMALGLSLASCGVNTIPTQEEQAKGSFGPVSVGDAAGVLRLHDGAEEALIQRRQSGSLKRQSEGGVRRDG